MPGLVLLLLCTLVGCIIYELINKVSPKNLPAIAYISFIAILITIRCQPDRGLRDRTDRKIGLLPLCTPILAYAGISIGKDVDTFKKQGICDRSRSDLHVRGNIPQFYDHCPDHLKMTGVI